MRFVIEERILTDDTGKPVAGGPREPSFHTFDAEDAEAAAPSPAEPEAGTAADADVTELIAKARAKLDTALDEDRAELKALIEIMKDCEERGDAAGRNEASAQIRDLLFYLEV